MGRESEVIVGREVQEPPAVGRHLGIGRAGERAQAATKPGVVERRELLGERPLRLHAAVMPSGLALVNHA